MASGFFALFDDIAALMDDVAAMSKVATKKTAGILGDDLAVNAEKATGFVSSRELPVIWAITKGSFLNKLIILPFIVLMSTFAPQLIVPILLVGGLYLAYEGAEKIFEYFFPHDKHHKATAVKELSPEEQKQREKLKIRSAIITDFILSIEIIIIALSTVKDQPLLPRILVLFVIAIITTVGVYGIVALIVRLDDFGYRLVARSEKNNNKPLKSFGLLMVKSLPVIIKVLAVIGTLAMLLVAGGIYVHNIHIIHEWLHSLPTLLAEFLTGLVIGIIMLAIINPLKHLFKKYSAKS